MNSKSKGREYDNKKGVNTTAAPVGLNDKSTRRTHENTRGSSWHVHFACSLTFEAFVVYKQKCCILFIQNPRYNIGPEQDDRCTESAEVFRRLCGFTLET